MKQLFKALGVLVFTLLVWAVFALVWGAPTVPAPWNVIVNLADVFRHGMLGNIVASGWRILISSLLALILGVPLGIAVGYKQSVSQILSPFIYFSYPVPKLALLPVLMLLFGLGETSKVLMIFMIIFFPVVMDVTAAVRGMDREIFDVMRSFGLSGGAICRRVILPGLWPTILNSLKVTTGIALSGLFFAENYGTTQGMGYFIMNSWQKMDYLDLYTGVLILALLGFALFCIFDAIERKITSWK